MRRSPVSVLFFFSLALILALTACGGGGTPASNVAASVVLSPTSVSMNRGDVATITAQAQDSKHAIVSTDLLFTSNNPSLVSISNSGSLCAGTWDTNFVVCTPATTTGTAVVSVAVKNNTAITASATVYVHAKVDRVVLNPLVSGCLSSGKTQLLTATAYSTDANTCTVLGAGAPPCVVPNSSLGQYTFNAVDADVVSIDNVTVPGTATGNIPGLTSVIASVSNVNSSASPFLVCPIVSLTFRNGDTHDTAPFTLAKAATKTMEVTAVDSAGLTLTAPPVSYYSNNPYAMRIASGSTAAPGSSANATITAGNSGSQSLFFASCQPPVCNKNLTGVYSDGIFGTVSGTLTAPTIFAASTNSLSIIPIDSSNSTPGTAITLPYLPNSFLINRQGTKGILGSDSNPLMLFDPVAKTVATISGVVGAKALAISPDGNFAFVTNSTASYLVNLSTSTITIGSPHAPAIKAQFSPDSLFAYFTTGTGTLYSVNQNTAETFIYNEGANITDLAILANGPAIYLAQGGAVNALGTCNLQNETPSDSQSGTAPSLLAAVNDASGITAVDGASLLYINHTAVSQACPPSILESTTAIPLGFATGTARQNLATLDATKAVVTSTANQVSIVTLATSTAKQVTLGGSANVAGTAALNPDSAFLWVGGTDNTVHKIDLNAGTDTAQIAVALKDASSNAAAPNLIAVKAN